MRKVSGPVEIAAEFIYRQTGLDIALKSLELIDYQETEWITAIIMSPLDGGE